MSYFHGAHGVTIEGDVTTINAKNYIQHTASSSSNNSIEKLRDHIAAGAMHDSAERSDAPKCHPETRVAVQDEIVSWILHGDDEEEPKKVLWVTGPAGGGKTAIMGSTADTCHKKGLLACGFFFSSFAGTVDRRTKRCFVATLAYQLVQHDAMRDVGERILSRVERNPAIFERQLEVQLDQLLLQPLRESPKAPDSPTWPKIIVIDGLDECEAEQYGDAPLSPQAAALAKEADQAEILHALFKAANDPSFPFRIIIASRPEHVIQSFFTDVASYATRRIFLDEKYNPDADMTLFLESKFAGIRRRYQLPASWPPEEDKQTLVRNASGQFIYVATVMRFIEGLSAPPPQILNQVLRLGGINASNNPFAPLDALYTHILNSSPNPLLAAQWIFLIFSTPFLAPPDNPLSARFIQLFLESSPGEASYVFRGLNSLVSIPPTDDHTSPFSLFHKSLTDFLMDQSRSGSLYVDYLNVRRLYHIRYLQIWKDKAPMQPISSHEKDIFLDKYLELFQAMEGSHFFEQTLLSCDIACPPPQEPPIALHDCARIVQLVSKMSPWLQIHQDGDAQGTSKARLGDSRQAALATS
ncbi:hypothetical protein EST38_g8129 [Candolleomyces aberdarensis]|uniref:NACHT domain-containing protein n=1 Tax=Candolleomyces aberdarensis TaxID=2316362 RepID=A0A4Q2DDE8_9AGAR|nr:hypothetical protein EST38_g8129 [Candolleomyces aberdarensis]